MDALSLPGLGHRYEEAVARFDVEEANAFLAMNAAGEMNAAEICCLRHAAEQDRVALRHRAPDGTTRTWTFTELNDASSRLAGVMRDLGLGRGDRVASLLPRGPELLITMFAAWRLGAVYQPFFTAFGPKAIEHRLTTAGTKLVVTNAEYRAKLAEAEAAVVVMTVDATDAHSSDHDFWSAVDARMPDPALVALGPDDPFLIMFTSGTTGLAKPLLVPLRAIAAFASYVRYAVGVRPDDCFWNLADPGWAYGLYFGVTGPLALGHGIILHEGSFSVASAYATIREYGVTNLAGSPTAYRQMMAAGPEAASAIKEQLRAVSSAGEPLNPEVIEWFDKHLATRVLDHYGQTEVGMVLCNHHGLEHPFRIGSAGYATPGHRLVVLSEDDRELGPGEPGELSLDRMRSPMMWFEGYLGREAPARDKAYHRTGDMVMLNDDGSISFVGRADDVITTSGYRVGPFDVESALIEHPAVFESAVIGKPDPERTEIIKAFVILNAGFDASSELADALRLHVRARLSAHAYPREIEFVDDLPKTPSGKVQRFLLRQREMSSADPAA